MGFRCLWQQRKGLGLGLGLGFGLGLGLGQGSGLGFRVRVQGSGFWVRVWMSVAAKEGDKFIKVKDNMASRM